jgi:hypothetical protein
MRAFAQKQNQPQQISSANLTSSNVPASAPSHEAHPLLHLQRTVGNQAVLQLLKAGSNEAGAHTAPQATLTVSTPGDSYEQEADQLAEQVMRMPEPQLQRACACSGGCPSCQTQQSSQAHEHLQTKPAGTSASGQTTTSPLVNDVLGSSGQPLDTATRAFMEPRFGYDFSGVRVHNDANADTTARALNARAFTIGGDVSFASGEFQPETAAGRHLLAHELGHVIQQSGGSQGAAGSSPLRRAARSIQRYVKTLGGRWDTTKYQLVRKELGKDVTGLDIELNFTPEDPVDAELIGLTQTVRLYREGKPLFVEESFEGRATPDEKGVEKGVHIDQPETANPLYATGEAATGDTLASTRLQGPAVSVEHEVRDPGQHGWHYRDASGAPQHQDAILRDKPVLRIPAKNSGQIFETTALAIKGHQEGTYYGSVKWGWETDEDGTLTQLPLSVHAMGVPSATFMRAAELWNKATTSKGAATIDLPTTKLPSSSTLGATTTAGLVIDLAQINKDLASMSPGPDKTNKEFEKTALEFELAKRRDRPTISLADQESTAAAMSTPDLIKRASDLPEEIWKLSAEPWVGSTTNKEIELHAVNRELRKRKLLVTVHVHETDDVFSDNVYVEAPIGAKEWSSSVVKLNNGDENVFVAPLSSVLRDASVDLTSYGLLIEAYDEDVGEDDLMFRKTWQWSDLPATDTQSRGGGKYTVRVDFSQP